MRLTKKAKFKIIYWTISWVMIIATIIVSIVQILTSNDKFVVFLGLSTGWIILGMQILFHWIFYVSIRNLTFGENESTGKDVFNFLLAFASGAVLLLGYSLVLGAF